MVLSWKWLNEIAEKNAEDHSCEDDLNTVTVAETTRLIWCARKYKETMRELARFYKTHSIKNLSELAQRLAEIEKGGGA